MTSYNTSHSSKMRIRPADRDLSAQVAMLRSAISRHSFELDRLLAGTGSCSDQPLKPGECQLFDPAAMDQRLGALKGTSDRALETELRKAKKLGAVRRLANPPSAAAIDRLARSFPHFEPVIELVRQRAALAEVTPGRVYTLPPILLSGDPGVGKTAFCNALASCLSVPTRRVDMAAATASFVLSGSHPSWSSARPGAVWALLQSSVACGLLLLDEIDKASSGSYPTTGPLYALLEPASSRHFADEFIEVEVDASHLMTVATCNDADQIERALRSRFSEFVIPVPTSEQMLAIVTSVYRERSKQSAWGAAFPEELDPKIAEQLTACTPRQVASLLETAVAHAASHKRRRVALVDVQYAQAVHQQSKPKHRHVGFI